MSGHCRPPRLPEDVWALVAGHMSTREWARSGCGACRTTFSVKPATIVLEPLRPSQMPWLFRRWAHASTLSVTTDIGDDWQHRWTADSEAALLTKTDQLLQLAQLRITEACDDQRMRGHDMCRYISERNSGGHASGGAAAAADCGPAWVRGVLEKAGRLRTLLLDASILHARPLPRMPWLRHLCLRLASASCWMADTVSSVGSLSGLETLSVEAPRQVTFCLLKLDLTGCPSLRSVFLARVTPAAVHVAPGCRVTCAVASSVVKTLHGPAGNACTSLRVVADPPFPHVGREVYDLQLMRWRGLTALRVTGCAEIACAGRPVRFTEVNMPGLQSLWLGARKMHVCLGRLPRLSSLVIQGHKRLHVDFQDVKGLSDTLSAFHLCHRRMASREGGLEVQIIPVSHLMWRLRARGIECQRETARSGRKGMTHLFFPSAARDIDAVLRGQRCGACASCLERAGHLQYLPSGLDQKESWHARLPD